MKKYMQPVCEVITLQVEDHILSGSMTIKQPGVHNEEVSGEGDGYGEQFSNKSQWETDWE